jgi:hypothetical protein
MTMPLKWKIFSALIVAGAAVLVVAIGGLWWFNTSGLPVLQRHNLEILMLPGLLVSLFLIGVVWYKTFIWSLRLVRADLDAE